MDSAVSNQEPLSQGRSFLYPNERSQTCVFPPHRVCRITQVAEEPREIFHEERIITSPPKANGRRFTKAG